MFSISYLEPLPFRLCLVPTIVFRVFELYDLLWRMFLDGGPNPAISQYLFKKSVSWQTVVFCRDHHSREGDFFISVFMQLRLFLFPFFFKVSEIIFITIFCLTVSGWFRVGGIWALKQFDFELLTSYWVCVIYKNI